MECACCYGNSTLTIPGCRQRARSVSARPSFIAFKHERRPTDGPRRQDLRSVRSLLNTQDCLISSFELFWRPRSLAGSTLCSVATGIAHALVGSSTLLAGRFISSPTCRAVYLRAAPCLSGLSPPANQLNLSSAAYHRQLSTSPGAGTDGLPSRAPRLTAALAGAHGLSGSQQRVIKRVHGRSFLRALEDGAKAVSRKPTEEHRPEPLCRSNRISTVDDPTSPMCPPSRW
jgi:hypothetical protein